MISDCLDYDGCLNLEINNKNLESCVVEIKLHKKQSILVALLYRPPNSNERDFQTSFGKFLKQLSSLNKEYLIGMDHNYDLLKHSMHDPTQQFLEMVLDQNLLPTITVPTRITKSTATLIDNILVSKNLYKNYTSAVMLHDISDHMPCVLVLKLAKVSHSEPVSVFSRKITPKMLRVIKSELNCVDWSAIVHNINLNTGFTDFHQELTRILDKHALYCSYTPSANKKRHEPWLIPNILKCIKKQLRLYKTMLHKDATEIDHQKYKDGDIYQYSSKAISNAFGKYFASVGNQYAEKIPQPTKTINEYNKLIPRNPTSEFQSLSLPYK